MKSYIDAGNFSGWHTMLKKDGLQNVTCQVFADYARGSIASAEDFTSTIEQVIKAYYAE
jgi:raffinose/stachyose/melibiose transport system substrate-binding protein